MKKVWFLVLGITALLFLAACSTGEAGGVLGKNRCPYTVKCGNVKGPVLTLIKDNGIYLSRGILTYEPSEEFALIDIKPLEIEGEKAGSFNVAETFKLNLCESKQVDWPIDDCDTCTKPVELRLVGFSGDKNDLALVELNFLKSK